MNRNLELEILEHEARRLRARHVGALLTRLAVAVDLRLRQVAQRVAAGLGGW